MRQQRAKNVSGQIEAIALGQLGVKTTDDRDTELVMVKSLKEMR